MTTTTDASPVSKTPATQQRGIPATAIATVVDRKLPDEMLGSDVDFSWPQQNEVTSSSMALADSQQLRMVERLRAAGKQPVTARYRSPRSTSLTPAAPMAPTFALAGGQATRRKPPVRPHDPVAIQPNQDFGSLVARAARRRHGRQKRCRCPPAPHD
jgi:hypothetical protein